MTAPFPRPVIMQRVAQVLKASQVHALTNQLLRTGIQQLHEVIAAGSADGPLTILWASDAMFVNQRLVTAGPGVGHTIDAFKKLFDRLKAHELVFDATASEADIVRFLELFQKHWHSSSPEAVVGQPGPIRFRQLGKDEIDAMGAGTVDRRQNVLRAYARLATLTRVVVDHAKANRPFKLSLVRRAIQQLAEASVGAEGLLAGITRFPNLQGELHFHLVATATLTLLMARRLDLSRSMQLDLVQAALFHDLARFDIVTAGADVEARRLLSLELPTRAMLTVTNLAFTRDAMLAATLAFESALPMQNEDAQLRPGVAARLVAVASFFSRLTSPLPPRRAFAPDQALHMLRRRAGTVFDAGVVTLFIHTVGLFPVGTTVRLSTGELAVVLEISQDPSNGARPVVKIFRSGGGAAVEAIVDLAHDSAQRTVLEALPPEQTLNPMPFLLA